MTDTVLAPTGTVHIAGPLITVGQQMRQRCSWCGHLLTDWDADLVAVPEGQEPSLPHWELGRLVLVDGGMSAVLDDTERLPENACARQPDAPPTG